MNARSHHPIVATPLRMALSLCVVMAIVLFAGVRFRRFEVPAFLGDSSAKRIVEVPGFAAPALAIAIAALVVLHLRGEEARLTRQLRTARTGTSAMRRLAVEKRRRFSTGLGVAAIQLASGDRDGALDALAHGSPWLAYGRISKLRALIEADADRASDAEAPRALAIATLREAPALDNVEADRYRVHVLVKAILEHGDLILARDVAHDLENEPAWKNDEDLRVYLVWLRAWFSLDHIPEPSDTDRRLALLLAKNHGASDLVAKLEGVSTEPAT